MTTTIRLSLIAALFLVVATYVFRAQSPLIAQEPTTQYSKSDLQDLYVAYLKKEGYLPLVDGDGDVQFKLEGRSYFIAVDAKDPQLFRLVFPNFWKIENEAERQKVLIAANHATGLTKVAKVFMVKDQVLASIEIFVESPEDFQPVFKRSISALKGSVENFATKMRE